MNYGDKVKIKKGGKAQIVVSDVADLDRVTIPAGFKVESITLNHHGDYPLAGSELQAGEYYPAFAGEKESALLDITSGVQIGVTTETQIDVSRGVFQGTQEVLAMTVTVGAVTDGGTVTVTLNDVPYTAEVVQGWTTEQVAAHLALRASYTPVLTGVWTAVANVATVTFTAVAYETKAGAHGFVDTDTTGVVVGAGITDVVVGADPAGAGNITVTLNGTVYTVALLPEDVTPGSVASKIIDEVNTGVLWSAEAGDGGIIIFTAMSVGATAGVFAFNDTETGVTINTNAPYGGSGFNVTRAGVNAFGAGNLLITLDDVLFTVPFTGTESTNESIRDLIVDYDDSDGFTGWVVYIGVDQVLFLASAIGVRDGAYTVTAVGSGITATLVEDGAGTSAYTAYVDDTYIAATALTSGVTSTFLNLPIESGMNLTKLDTEVGITLTEPITGDIIIDIQKIF